MICTCGRIHVGSTTTELRNWNPACAEHGVESEWYADPVQVAKRAEDRQRLIDLQRRATEARRKAREGN